jgi:hypothetical protein
LRVNGRDKLVAKSFLAGLFAQLRPKGGRVMLYARLRLGAGRRVIVLQRHVKGSGWKQLERVTVDGRSSFQRTFRHAPGAQYRLTYPTAAGKRASSMALKPVRADG